MKTGIHPDYNQITISCGCGNSFQVGSTNKGDMRVEICSHCHPLYTGKSNLIDTAGRLDRFQARQKKAQEHQAAAQLRAQAKVAKSAESESEPEAAEAKK